MQSATARLHSLQLALIVTTGENAPLLMMKRRMVNTTKSRAYAKINRGAAEVATVAITVDLVAPTVVTSQKRLSGTAPC